MLISKIKIMATPKKVQQDQPTPNQKPKPTNFWARIVQFFATLKEVREFEKRYKK